MSDRTLGQYRIIYSNGVVQVCDLISQKDFMEDIQATKDRIHDLQVAKDTSGEIQELKQALMTKYGDNYFTDGSPIYQAMETGILVLPHYTAPIKVEKI